MAENIIGGDTLIIGGGPGGYALAAAESAAGRKVIIIEKSHVGGTCLNRGCIPTKCLCASASALASSRSATALGINIPDTLAVDIDTVRAHKDKVVEGLRNDISGLLSKCTLICAEASFDDQGCIIANGNVYEATRTIIATGSRPASLPIPGAELCVSSDTMLSLESIPTSLCVIGGGVIGLELASVYAEFGSEVTVVEFLPEILPNFDTDIARRLRSMLQRRGIKIVTSAAVSGVTLAPDGRRTVVYNSRGKEQSISADVVLMAVGRNPVLPLGIETSGISIGAKGRIDTDIETFATSREGFYAIGDCAGSLPMLAHVAEAQAKILSATFSNTAIPQSDFNCIPSVIYTRPEAFSTGMSEAAARNAGIDIVVKKQPVASNGYARAIGCADGLLKTIADATTGCILGIHYVGPAADTLVGEAQLAIAQGMNISDLRSIIHPHPTLTELIHSAL